MTNFMDNDRVVHRTLGEGVFRGYLEGGWGKEKAFVHFDDHDHNNWIAVPTASLELVKSAGPPEPSPGSIARHVSMSVAYSRPWGQLVDGQKNWASTQLLQPELERWDDIKHKVVVIVDTNGADSYRSSGVWGNDA